MASSPEPIDFFALGRRLDELSAHLPGEGDVQLERTNDGLQISGTRTNLAKRLLNLAAEVVFSDRNDNAIISLPSQDDQTSGLTILVLPETSADTAEMVQESWLVKVGAALSVVGCLAIAGVFILGLVKLVEAISHR